MSTVYLSPFLFIEKKRLREFSMFICVFAPLIPILQLPQLMLPFKKWKHIPSSSVVWGFSEGGVNKFDDIQFVFCKMKLIYSIGTPKVFGSVFKHEFYSVLLEVTFFLFSSYPPWNFLIFYINYIKLFSLSLHEISFYITLIRKFFWAWVPRCF